MWFSVSFFVPLFHFFLLEVSIFTLMRFIFVSSGIVCVTMSILSNDNIFICTLNHHIYIAPLVTSKSSYMGMGAAHSWCLPMIDVLMEDTQSPIPSSWGPSNLVHWFQSRKPFAQSWYVITALIAGQDKKRSLFCSIRWTLIRQEVFTAIWQVLVLILIDD